MHSNFHKTQVKLFPNFLSIPFDSLSISWVANYSHNRDLLKLHALKSLKQTFQSSQFYEFCVQKILVRVFPALLCD